MSETELSARHVLDAVMSALMQMQIEEHGLEAVSASRNDEKNTVTVELQGRWPEFERRPCVCKDEDDDMCDPCIEAEEHAFDEPDYLSVVVKLESAVTA